MKLWISSIVTELAIHHFKRMNKGILNAFFYEYPLKDNRYEKLPCYDFASLLLG